MHLTSGTILTLLAGACVLIQNVTSAVTDPIVELKQGKVKGKLAVSRNGKNFVQYKGLPYCSKPVRFQVDYLIERYPLNFFPNTTEVVK